MRNKLCSVLCLLLVFLTVLGSVSAMAAPVPMTWFNVEAVDAKTGEGAFYEEDRYALTSHQIKIRIAQWQPSGANISVKWKSSAPSIASINAKGIITCKKAGSVTITVTAKYGDQQMEIPLHVIDNGAFWGNFPESEKADLLREGKWGMYTRRIYVKGGKTYAEMNVFNGSSYVLRGSGKFYVGYSLNASTEPFSEYKNLGKFAVKMIGKIQPGTEGIAVISLGKKLNPAILDLTDAAVDCSLTPYNHSAATKNTGDLASHAGSSAVYYKKAK